MVYSVLHDFYFLEHDPVNVQLSCKTSYMHIKVPVGWNPSCLQMTLPSRTSQLLSHTVPHALLIHTSTLPSRLVAPPTSLTSPSEQLLKLVVKAKMIHQSCAVNLCIHSRVYIEFFTHTHTYLHVWLVYGCNEHAYTHAHVHTVHTCTQISYDMSTINID